MTATSLHEWGDDSPLRETCESEGPKCPYCGRQYTADVQCYFDEERYTEETCDSCGETFDVEVYTETTWTCTERRAAHP